MIGYGHHKMSKLSSLSWRWTSPCLLNRLAQLLFGYMTENQSRCVVLNIALELNPTKSDECNYACHESKMMSKFGNHSWNFRAVVRVTIMSRRRSPESSESSQP